MKKRTFLWLAVGCLMASPLLAMEKTLNKGKKPSDLISMSPDKLIKLAQKNQNDQTRKEGSKYCSNTKEAQNTPKFTLPELYKKQNKPLQVNQQNIPKFRLPTLLKPFRSKQNKPLQANQQNIPKFKLPGLYNEPKKQPKKKYRNISNIKLPKLPGKSSPKNDH